VAVLASSRAVGLLRSKLKAAVMHTYLPRPGASCLAPLHAGMQVQWEQVLHQALPATELVTISVLIAFLALVCACVSTIKYAIVLYPATIGAAQTHQNMPEEYKPRLSLVACPNSSLVRLVSSGNTYHGGHVA
jgi:hypothetical protein